MRLLPLILALIIGAQPLGEAFFYLWYLADNKSFTNTFCENIDKPELTCNGKCHLKAIAETPVAPEKGLPEPRQLESPLPPSVEPPLPSACLTTNDNAFPYQPLLDGDWKTSLLRPPIRVC